MSKTGARLAWAVAWAVGAGGCASILGIEEQTFRGGTDAGDVGAGQEATTAESSGSTPGGSSGSGSGSTSGSGVNPSGSGAAGSGGSGSGVPGSSGSIEAGPTGSSGNASSGNIPHGKCLDGITDFENAGPFTYSAVAVPSSTTPTGDAGSAAGSINILVPAVPAGCKVPVIHLANGTSATCAPYQNVLNRLASHGFLTTCYEDPNTGAGTQAITAFDDSDHDVSRPRRQQARLHGTLPRWPGGIHASCSSRRRSGVVSYIYAGLAMEPASGFGTQPSGGTWQQVYGEIKSPMFMFSGTSDMLVSAAWVGQAFSAMNPKNEVYWWSATGATHIPTPQVPEEQVSIPWFRWKLFGDNAACKFFKAMPGNTMISPGWTKQMSENEAPCQ